MTAAPDATESAAKWAEARAALADGRDGEARIAAIWAGAAACDEGLPLEQPPAGDDWLVLCWRRGWRSQRGRREAAEHTASRAARLPYADS